MKKAKNKVYDHNAIIEHGSLMGKSWALAQLNIL